MAYNVFAKLIAGLDYADDLVFGDVFVWFDTKCFVTIWVEGEANCGDLLEAMTLECSVEQRLHHTHAFDKSRRSTFALAVAGGCVVCL